MCLQFPNAEKLTTAEETILEYIESNYEEFLFMTIGEVAEKLSVSEATISRFARHLGCRDFKELKQSVNRQKQTEGPVGKMAGTILKEEALDELSYFVEQQQYLVKTLEHLGSGNLERAVEAISQSGKIFIHAKNASVSMAQLLFFRLRRLGFETELLSGGSELLEGLSRAGQGDLVIFFSFSKLSYEAGIILQEQKNAGYGTLAFTGRLHAPAEELADINLYVYRGSEREYHSMTAAAALVDTIVVALMKRRGAEGAERLKKLHCLKKKYGRKK